MGLQPVTAREPASDEEPAGSEDNREVSVQTRPRRPRTTRRADARSSIGNSLQAASARRANRLAIKLLALLGTLLFASALCGVLPVQGQQSAASLSGLTVTPGTLDPAFSSTVTDYTVTVAHDVNQITIVGTPAGAGAVAYYRPGTPGPFGLGPPTLIPDADTTTDGHQVAITVTRTAINVVVTEAGHDGATYYVTVTREAPPTASLSGLTVTPGTLDPAFSSTVTSYTFALAHDVDQITIVATPAGAGAVAFYNPPATFFGPETPIADADATADGQQVDITESRTEIRVEATEASRTPTRYTLIVNREAPPVVDRPALMALYQSTGGASWTDNTNWGSNEPLEDWAGVTTDETSGRVTRLALSNNNLSGTLPAEMGSLDQLTRLFLGGNNLVGTLPAELGRLTNLTNLSLINNQLSGTVPSLSRLTSLKDLRLLNNQFGGSLPNLSSLASLQHLYLGGNGFTGTIPAWLSNLTGLVYLGLESNQLTGSIPSLTNLTGLQYLILHDNQLSGTIPGLSANTKLWYVHLENNQLSGSIPASLGSSHTLLQYLYLDHNRLTGSIPATLGDLPNLLQLTLNNNQDEQGQGGLTGSIPATLGNLTNLQILRLNTNQLSGTIPDLSRLTAMWELSLWGNSLTGGLPSTLGSATNLYYLYLSDNLLTGTIPDLSNLTNLQRLYLDRNSLDGSIPTTLGSLTNLTDLSLWGNALTGSVPSNLSSSLLYVYLGGNNLSGTIPNLSNLTNLLELSLWGNALTGSIPTTLSRLTNLQHLHLHQNQLSGPIPDSLGNITSLVELKLQENQLTESIPSNLNSLTNLSDLFLNQNQLTGTIPDLSNLTNLQTLHLHENDLSGTIPVTLGSLNLQNTRFAGNAFTGCVPHELRHLVTSAEFEPGVPAHDFIAVDANGDSDTDDDGDTPGLNLPFCLLSALMLSDVTLVPPFAVDTTTYTALVDNGVAATTVMATLNESGDSASTKKGASPSANPVPLDVGSNVITVDIAPADGTPGQTYTVTVFREGMDRAALLALYNSAGGASWTNKTNWGVDAEPISTWFGVTTNASGNVTALSLPDNNLVGTLPAELGSLTNLTTLDLSDNRLSGEIPDLRALVSLSTLDLRDNRLNEKIPDLSLLTSLTALDLGGNSLSGPIPDSLGALTGLRSLSLRANDLTGTIPSELGDLYQLDLLYLDGNQLSGPIPDSLGSLLQLDVARFAGNAFGGCVPKGLRHLVTAPEYAPGVPAHDFIAVDANADGDTDDAGDTPGLELAFCTLRALTFSGNVILKPAFASDTLIYAASAPHAVAFTTVTAAPHNFSDAVSITKAGDSYASGDEAALDVGPNVFTIEVTPADATPMHTYTVTVTRERNTPPVFVEGATATRGLAENTASGVSIGDPVAASDADNDALTYGMDSAGAEFFDIDGASGQLRTKAALDYETRASYAVTVSVSDIKDDNSEADTATDTTIAVTVLVTNVNEVPEFPLSESGMRSVDENTAAGVNIGTPVAAEDGDGEVLTYSLDPAAVFDIGVSTGQLLTEADLDFETTRSHLVTVTATDSSGETDTVLVTISVSNVDEAGAVSLSAVQPQAGTELTATVSDPDTILTNIDWLWERSPNQTNWTTVSSTQDEPRRSSYLPTASDVGGYMRATASYADGHGFGKSAHAVSESRVQAAPTPENNPPRFPSTVIESRHRYVDENTPAGENIGEPVTATDADNDTLTYSLGGPDASSFDIVPTTGQLLTEAPLDREAMGCITATHMQCIYTVTVTATDPSGDSSTIEITITVFNVDEPGTVALSLLQPQVGTRLLPLWTIRTTPLASAGRGSVPRTRSIGSPSAGPPTTQQPEQAPTRRAPTTWATTCESPPPTSNSMGPSRLRRRSRPMRRRRRRAGTRRCSGTAPVQYAPSPETRVRARTSAGQSRPSTSTTTS